MITFGISAPGKVILFGEHAVVHGKTAVAVSLDRRTNLVFCELPPKEIDIIVELPKVEISEKISVEQLNERIAKLSDVDSHEKLLELVRDLVKTEISNDSRKKISMECFFYALFQIIKSENLELKPFRIKLESELTIGAGTGSSASFSVCLNAAFLRWSQLQRNPDSSLNFSEDSLKRISKYAYNCEKIMHGMPSGIDNSVCTYGSVIRFKKGESTSFISLGSRSFRILLVNTMVGRNTKMLVDKVNELLNKFPTMFQSILKSIDEVSLSSIYFFKSLEQLQDLDDKENSESIKLFEELALLVDINQGLLSSCQVSHPTLDLICSTARKFGFSAKLTGAGGGGYAFVLIPPGSSNNKIDHLRQELMKDGFEVIDTVVGGSGVVIHNV